MVLCGVGVALAALAVLIAITPHTFSVRTHAARTIPRVAAYETQKKIIDKYIEAALRIHTQVRAKKLTTAQAQQQALALTVPGVLKERHLAWVVALGSANAAAADDLMREYAILESVQ